MNEAFTFPLADGMTGHVGFEVDGLADDTCTMAQGRGEIDLPAHGTVELDVFMTQRITPTCPVSVSLVGGGNGAVYSGGGEISCGARCAVELPRGTPLHLSLRLDDHAHFLGWSGACSGTQGCDLLVKGAYTQSRLRQTMFGGATRHILVNAGLPVLMAH